MLTADMVVVGRVYRRCRCTLTLLSGGCVMLTADMVVVVEICCRRWCTLTLSAGCMMLTADMVAVGRDMPSMSVLSERTVPCTFVHLAAQR